MIRQGVTSLAAALALGAALVPAPAHARVSVFSTGRYAVGPPRAAGSAIVWEEPLKAGYRVRRYSAGQTTTLREVHRRLLSAQLAASADGLLVQESAVQPNDAAGVGDLLLESATLSQSPVGGGAFIAQGAGCLFGSTYWCQLNSDIDGPNALVPGPPGASRRYRVISLRDSTVQREIDGVASPASIAGTKVAWIPAFTRDVVVYDWAAGRELYRLTLPPEAEISLYSPAGQVDVQSDGTVAIGYLVYAKRGRQTRALTRYGWASPSEPRFHPASFGTPLRTGTVQLERGTFLFTGHLRSGDDDGPFVAYVAPLRGKPRPLVTGVLGTATPAGDRLLWNERTCSGTRIASASLAELERHPLDRTAHCRLRFTKPVRVDRDGHAVLNIDCTGFDRDCQSQYEILSAAATRRYGRGIRSLRRGAEVLALDRPGGSGKRLKYKLTSAARTQLRLNKRLLIRIKVALPYSPMRQTTLTLRAP